MADHSKMGENAMAEYIDREEAKFHFTTAFPQLGISVEKAVYQAIDDVPPADVAPVVHAHWINASTAGVGPFWECSACHELAWGVTDETNYCHHCGAKMDEEVDDA